MTPPERIASFLAELEPSEVDRLEHHAGQAGAAPPEPAAHAKIAVFDDAVSGDRFTIRFHQRALSRIRVDLNHGVVTKVVERYAEHGIVEREAEWLERLADSGRTPALLGRNGATLSLSYVGEPVRHGNLPGDWADQAAAIIAMLEDHGCSHNDIKCDNLTVLDGRIHLIDFGWATAIGDPIPSQWPQGIGRQHRLGVHSFDDRRAISAALASAEHNAIDHSIVMAG